MSVTVHPLCYVNYMAKYPRYYESVASSLGDGALFAIPIRLIIKYANFTPMELVQFLYSYAHAISYDCVIEILKNAVVETLENHNIPQEVISTYANYIEGGKGARTGTCSMNPRAVLPTTPPVCQSDLYEMLFSIRMDLWERRFEALLKVLCMAKTLYFHIESAIAKYHPEILED